MNKLGDVWSKRFQSYLIEVQHYFKFIFTGHLVIVFVFGLGAFGFYYSEWLKAMPTNFPAAGITAFVVGVLLIMSTPVTLLKEADGVFFLPMESQMKEWKKRSVRWTTFSGLLFPLAAFVIALPMLSRTLDVNGAYFLFMAISIIVLKFWNVELEFESSWQLNGDGMWIDRFIRWTITTLYLWAVFSWQPIWMLLSAVPLVIYALMSKKLSSDRPFPFPYFIDMENRRMMRFYRFANYFTDVPHIQGAIRHRSWMNVLLNRLPFKQSNAQLYYMWRKFVRTNDIFYLWVRLVGLSLIILVFIHSPLLAGIIAVIFSFAAAFQIKEALSGVRVFQMEHLYPIAAGSKWKAMQIVVRTLSIIFSILLFVVSTWAIHSFVNGLLIGFISSIVAEMTIRMKKKNISQ